MTGASYLVGVDIGGTFTDAVVVSRDGSVTTGKVSTAPSDFSIGFFGAVADAARSLELSERQLLERTSKLVHGTTVGVNALVTGSVAQVALLATSGHGDAIRGQVGQGRIRGASIEEILDFSASSMPEAVVPPSHVLEVSERVGPTGEVVVALSDDEVERLLGAIGELSVQAVAVSLLWSFVNPDHERRLSTRIRDRFPEMFVSCSHEVAPKIGEYGRTVSTVMNAQIGPLMQSYISRIVDQASGRGFGGEVLFGQSEGGLVPGSQAARFPVLTIQSGPVAGVVGSAIVSERMGYPNVIVTDMGGTTLDVSVVTGGRVAYIEEREVIRQLVYGRAVDVESVGAGGGSIAWIHGDSGTLRVGPRSAGAAPGPICYGRGGTEVTVTDADLVLGILDPGRPLAGGLALDRDAAAQGIARLAEQLDLSLEECAAGIVEIVDSRMEDLIRRVTVQRGHDPRTCVLFAYGGASGAHAGIYGRGIGVQSIVFPLGNTASVWSAYGLNHLQHTRTFEASANLSTPFDLDRVSVVLKELDDTALAYARAHEIALDQCRLVRRADMKYPLQAYTVEADLPELPIADGWDADLMTTFRRTYEDRFGSGTAYEAAGAVVTAVRVTIEVQGPAAPLPQALAITDTPRTHRLRPVYWRELGGWHECPVFSGEDFVPGSGTAGPALIEYDNTTIVVRPHQSLRVDTYGNPVLDLEGSP